MQRTLRRLTVGLTAATLAAVGVVVPAAAAQAAPPTELFVSEYIEGSSNNKAIEIANLTGAPVDLGASDYDLKFSFNGSSTVGLTIQLTGTVASGDVHVVAQSTANAAILAVADQTSSASWFNGDDAIVLTRSDVVVDAFGQVGFDPGTEWGSALISTADNTLRRGDAFCVGDGNPGDGFDPSIQWTGLAQDTVDGLGAHSATCEGSDPEPPPVADCAAPAVAINSVQGPGDASPRVGETVEISGVVVGDFQEGGFDGYYVQETASVDADPMTSEGIFVYASGGAPVSVGDQVHAIGSVSEYNGLTEITASSIATCATGSPLPAPTTFGIPNEPQNYEALEGMLVTLPQTLTILEYFNFGRYGEMALGTERQMQPTAVYAAGTPEAVRLAQQNALKRIVLDDGRSTQNPDPAIHPNGRPFSLENTFRGGDRLTDVTGILDHRFGLWRVQPTQGARYEPANARPGVPEVGGNLTVASFNVLNYFTSIGTGDAFRGANTQEEFDRQEAKIVSAITAIDADVFGLIEIQNNGTAVQVLVDAINDAIGADTYEALITGPLGTDAITTALIYKPSAVGLVGDHAVLDSTVDPDFDTTRNRPALAQTFADLESGEEVTVVVNHLKSKGSACAGDPDTGDGQGNCNLTRTKAAEALADWLATGPTGAEPGRELIIGDLNSYDKEDPIQALTGRGYADLLLQEQGENAYSYVFDGQLGYLDYALAGSTLAAQVTGAAAWAINADEPSLIDYDMTNKKDAQDGLYAADQFRSSDHDPVVVGIELPVPDTTDPELRVTADPATIAKATGKYVTVNLEVVASDDSGTATFDLVDTAATGKKADLQIVSDTQVRVKAVRGAVYTLTYEATDPSGNTTTEAVTIRVAS